MLVFLHGRGEIGNSKENPDDLLKVLKHGPPKLIEKNQWYPPEPMYVASPQCQEDWWDRHTIDRFINYVIRKNENIDKNRIYLTGLSMGAFAIFNYLSNSDMSIQIAAAVPICGKGELTQEKINNLSKTPIWVFHGDKDDVVSPSFSKSIIKEIKKVKYKSTNKLTIYPKVKHDSWTITYNGSGMGQESKNYDVFDMDVFRWMCEHTVD